MSIPYKATINGKERDFEIPTKWSEVSEAQAVALSKIDTNNQTQIVSVLSGIPENLVKSMKGGSVDRIFESCAHLFAADRPDLQSMERSKVIEIRGKKYSTALEPKKILHGYLESIRVKLQEIQKEAEELSTEENKVEPKFYDYTSFYVAFCLAGKVLNGKYDEEEAIILASELSLRPVTEIFPIGRFFLSKLLDFYKIRRISLAQNILNKSYERELKPSKNLGRLIRWMR